MKQAKINSRFGGCFRIVFWLSEVMGSGRVLARGVVWLRDLGTPKYTIWIMI